MRENEKASRKCGGGGGGGGAGEEEERICSSINMSMISE